MSVFFPITCSPTVYCPLWWQPWFLLDVCQLIYHSHGVGYNVLAEDLMYSNKCVSNISLLLVTHGMWIFHHRDKACSALLYANGREETRAGLSHTMNAIVCSLQRQFIRRCLLLEQTVFLTASYWIPLPPCVSLGFGGAFLWGEWPLALFQEQQRSFRVESFTLHQ